MNQVLKAEILNNIINTQLTLQEIADKLNITYKIVWRVSKDNFTSEERKRRKVENYKKSKCGSLNPMYGKFGDKHHNYIGIVGDNKGYLMVLKPNWYTGRKNSKHVFLHSVIMCQVLGLSEIPKGFVVHHIDHNPHNNDIHNLVMLSSNAHSRLHSRERATTIPQGSRLQEKPKRAAPL